MKFFPSFSFLSSFFALIFFYFLLYSPSYDGSGRNNVRLDLYLDKETCDLTCVWTKWLVTWLGLARKWLVTWLGLARKWFVTWLGLARKWLVTWLGLAKNDLLPSLPFTTHLITTSPSPEKKSLYTCLWGRLLTCTEIRISEGRQHTMIPPRGSDLNKDQWREATHNDTSPWVWLK